MGWLPMTQVTASFKRQFFGHYSSDSPKPQTEDERRFSTSANPCKRIESTGFFAFVAFFSREGDMPFSFDTLSFSMCEVSALWIAF
jgi:hypothetical protein